MDIHQNARTTPHSRMLMVQRLADGWTVPRWPLPSASTLKTVRKWRDRFAAEGAAGLDDRSSRPHRSPTRLGDAAEDEIEALRRQRLTGPAIARQARPARLDRRRRAAPARPRPARRARPPARPSATNASSPGELIHIDTKKLGTHRRRRPPHHRPSQRPEPHAAASAGSTCMSAVDDASRLAYTEILPDERKESAAAFLERALACFAAHGVSVERVMTDNGSAYRSHLFRAGARRRRPHATTAPGPTRRAPTARPSASSRPRLREWAYAAAYQTSAERTQAMPPLDRRLQSATDPTQPSAENHPFSRLPKDNLLGNDT